MYFIYGEAELAYLRRKDKRLAAVIDRIGPVERTVDPDLFSAVVHHIIGQQISMKAQATIWQRMQDTLGTVSAETILAAGVPALQALGMTFRKAEYLTDLAGRIVDGSFDLPPADDRLPLSGALEHIHAKLIQQSCVLHASLLPGKLALA